MEKPTSKSNYKINFRDLATSVQKTIKDPNLARIIGTGAEMKTPTDPSDFVVFPQWWQEGTGTLGIPFGFVMMLAGNTDSGKTSATIEFMKAAQAQGVYVILADCEKKTTSTRLKTWGVNPDDLFTITPESLEEMYDGIWALWQGIKNKDPNAKILIIIDSIGNTPSFKEGELNSDDSMQMGLAAKINKRGFRKMNPRLRRDQVAIMVINYTYANMGSPGVTNAGGKAVDFFSCLTLQTSRRKWLEKKVKGDTVRIGAQVQWRLYKNHLLNGEAKRKEFLINITAAGMELEGSTSAEAGETGVEDE